MIGGTAQISYFWLRFSSYTIFNNPMKAQVIYVLILQKYRSRRQLETAGSLERAGITLPGSIVSYLPPSILDTGYRRLALILIADIMLLLTLCVAIINEWGQKVTSHTALDDMLPCVWARQLHK